MPHPVDPQPRLLQKVIGIRPVHRLQLEKTMQLRTDAIDERSGRGEIARLVAGHQHLGITVHIQTSIRCAPEESYVAALTACWNAGIHGKP
jgi:hypothetical protein